MCIFYDCVFRLIYLSGNVVGYIGFANIPDNFKQYFYTDSTYQTNLITYLETSSIMSELENVTKSVKNIDFRKYNIDNNLGFSQDDAGDAFSKEYFYRFGQFEQKIVKFIPSADSEIQQTITDGLRLYNDRINNGMRLFGKYYRGLWD